MSQNQIDFFLGKLENMFWRISCFPTDGMTIGCREGATTLLVSYVIEPKVNPKV
jgi:hypothetical protein